MNGVTVLAVGKKVRLAEDAGQVKEDQHWRDIDISDSNMLFEGTREAKHAVSE